MSQAFTLAQHPSKSMSSEIQYQQKHLTRIHLSPIPDTLIIINVRPKQEEY